MIYVEFFKRFWRLLVNRVLVVVFILLMVLSGILDAKYDGWVSPLEMCVGTLGVGGMFLLLGLNMFLLVPIDSNAYVRLRWRGQAALFMGGGALALWSAFTYCPAACLSR
jgi:hypothetical protein